MPRRACRSLALATEVVVVVLGLHGQLARLPAAVLLLLVATVCGWFGVTRRGLLRRLGVVVAAVAAGLFAVLVLTGGGHGLMLLVVLALSACSVGLTRYALRRDRRSIRALPAPGTPIGPARHGVLIVNPKSGGGKATHFELADVARRRGIEVVVLEPGSDLLQLAEDAADRGADVIGIAGGDGSQALAASVAMRHDISLVCIPAGTRNHFALDLGLDRDDVVEALDAFGHAVERRIDLAEVGGRVFVNNVSLGVYATIVHSPEYRDTKRETTAKYLPELLGPGAQPYGMKFTDTAGDVHDSAELIQVSNNPYALSRIAGFGTRPRLDTGTLGVSAVELRGAADLSRLLAAEAAGGCDASAATASSSARRSRLNPTGRSKRRSMARPCCSTRPSSSEHSPAPCEFGSPPTHPVTHPLRLCHRRSGGPCGHCSAPSPDGPRRSMRRSVSSPGPVRALVAAEGLDRCLAERFADRGVEVVAVQGLEEPVVVDEVAEAGAQLDEGEVDALGVELLVEALEHPGGGDVDVGDGLALQHHPRRPALLHELADLVGEDAGVGEEQWRLPAEHHDVGDARRSRHRPGRCASPRGRAPVRAPRRAATSCDGRRAGSTARRRRRCLRGRRGRRRRRWRRATAARRTVGTSTPGRAARSRRGRGPRR